MQRVLVPFLAAALGGAAGVLVTARLDGHGTPGASVTAEPGGTEVRDELAALRRLLERPTPLASAPRSGGPAGVAADGPAGAGAAATGGAVTREDLRAAIEDAMARGLEKLEAQRKESEAAAKAPKKRVPLAEVARELNLSGSQEDAVRRAYEEATEEFLDIMAKPESDAATLRRELEDAKSDPAKQMNLMTKNLPKLITKLGDFMAIESRREEKIRKAVGPDNARKLKAYDLAEEDPFGFGDGASMGFRVDAK